MKQRQTSYLMNNDQHISPNRGGYIPANFNNQSITRPHNSYDILQDQKLRLISFELNKNEIFVLFKKFFSTSSPSN